MAVAEIYIRHGAQINRAELTQSRLPCPWFSVEQIPEGNFRFQYMTDIDRLVTHPRR